VIGVEEDVLKKCRGEYTFGPSQDQIRNIPASNISSPA